MKNKLIAYFLFFLLAFPIFTVIQFDATVTAGPPVLIDQGLTWDRYHILGKSYKIGFSMEPINYYEDGAWNKISTSMYSLPAGHYARADGYTIGNEHGPFNVYFKPSTASSYPVAYVYDKENDSVIDALRSKFIGLAYVDPSNNWNYHILQTADDVNGYITGPKNNIIRYDNVIPGVNLSWKYTPSGLKEEIALSPTVKTYLQTHPPSSYGLSNQESYVAVLTKLQYNNLDVYNGTSRKTSNFTVGNMGAIFKDASDNIKFTLPIGVVYTDGNDGVKTNTTKMMKFRFLTYNGNTYLISGIKSTELNNMTFPVVYDPTTGYGEYNSQNGELYSWGSLTWDIARNLTTSMGIDTTSIMTRAHKNGWTYTIYRGYVFFDTSPLPDTAVISTAKLNFTVSYTIGGSQDVIVVGNSTYTYPGNTFEEADFDRTQYNVAVANFSATTGGKNISFTNFQPITKVGITGLCLQSKTYDYLHVTPPALHDCAINDEASVKLWVMYNSSTTQVLTNATTLIEETTATFNGFLNRTSSTPTTCGFWYDTNSGTPYTYNHSCGAVANHTAFTFSAGVSPALIPGTRYYVRAWAINALGIVNGTEVTFFTKPNPPASLTFTNTGADNIQRLTWTKGTGANNTNIRGLAGLTYPSTPTSGTNIYNGTSTTAYVNNTYLLPGQLYSFRAWSYTYYGAEHKDSDSYSSRRGLTKPYAPYAPMTNETSNTSTTTTYNLSWTIGDASNRTVLLRNSTGDPSYPTSATDGIIIYNGTGNYTSYTITHGVSCFISAFGYTPWIVSGAPPTYYCQFSDNYTTFSFLNYSSVQFNCFNESNMNQSLTFNILMNNREGTIVYQAYNVVNTYAINFTTAPSGQQIYIKVWATGYKFRETYMNIYNNTIYNLSFYLPPEAPPGQSFEECTVRPYTDSVTISTNATDAIIPLTYTLDDIADVQIYNITLYGTYGGWLFVPSSNYTVTGANVTINKSVLDYNTSMAKVSYYYRDCIGINNPPTLYYVRLVETIETEYSSYDKAVMDGVITFRRLNNYTGEYVTISSLLTDGNGYANLYLIPGVTYLIITSKTLYTTGYSSYTPPLPNNYGQVPEKWFRLVLITASSIPLPDITYLFKNIIWSIEPTNLRHNTSFTFWFNISSSDNQLEWFNMRVLYYNTTTNTWVSIFFQNTTTSSGGGTITYTVANVSGKYAVKCYFKKIGYPQQELGETGSLIHFIIYLKNWMHGIPDMAYYIVLLFIMIVVMGFFFLYFGTGISTGYIGLLVFAIGLYIHAVDIDIGTTTISGWLIFAITFMMYTMGIFLWSRM